MVSKPEQSPQDKQNFTEPVLPYKIKAKADEQYVDMVDQGKISSSTEDVNDITPSDMVTESDQSVKEEATKLTKAETATASDNQAKQLLHEKEKVTQKQVSHPRR